MSASYTATPIVYGDRGVARLLARARTSKVTLVLDGDSKRSASESGPWEVGAINMALAQKYGGLHRTGTIPAGGTIESNSGLTMWPIRNALSGGGALTSDAAYTGLSAGQKTALIALLPAGAINPNAYVVPDTNSNGIVLSLHGTGDAIHPSFATMLPDDSWYRDEAVNTYLDVWCLKCADSNYVDEIKVRVTPTDTVVGAVGVSAVQTLVSGGGNAGEPAAFALTGAALSTGTLVRRRFGPLKWKSSSTTRKTCQVNINANSSTAGKKAIVVYTEFVNTNQTTGLSLFPLAKASWAIGGTGGGGNSHYSSNGNASAVYQAIRDMFTADGVTMIGATQAGVNDAYVYSNTAATYKQNLIDRITQKRGWWGGVPEIIFVPEYRDSNTGSADSMDAEYDQYAGAACEAADALGNCLVINTRLVMHRIGLSRAGQNIGVPPTVAAWVVGTTYNPSPTVDYVYPPGVAGIVTNNGLTTSTGVSPRDGTDVAYYWRTMRNMLPGNDNVHLAGAGSAIMAPAFLRAIDEAIQYGLENSGRKIVIDD